MTRSDQVPSDDSPQDSTVSKLKLMLSSSVPDGSSKVFCGFESR